MVRVSALGVWGGGVAIAHRNRGGLMQEQEELQTKEE